MTHVRPTGPALREGLAGDLEFRDSDVESNARIGRGNLSFNDRRNSFRAGDVDAARFFEPRTLSRPPSVNFKFI